MEISTACPLDCPDTCSLTVHVTDEPNGRRISSIGAGPGNRFTDGWICAKVRGYASRVYSPERIMTPLRRTGAKGSGEFESISWSSAIDEIAGRMRAAIDAHGRDALTAYLYNSSGGALAAAGLTERLFRTLGSTEVAHTICAATTGASWASMYVGLLSADPSDVVHSDLVVIWGANPNVSNSHLPPLIRSGGADVVVVDPRRTAMAAKASQHLAILPGTDAALALAVAHVLERDDLLDHRFLDDWCDGVDEYLSIARRWTPDAAAAVCGIEVSEIEQFAARYASARPAVIRLGWGLERNANGGAS
ncbi:MAG: molybdopterin-dependent oxidoreductase, partial [Acidimicrobiia bacterium]